jgi:ribonuclease HI
MTQEQNAPVSPQEVTIYTDGGCEPNPGAGGYGAIVVCGTQSREISGGFKLTTNNRMEIFAAIAGLETLETPSQVTLVSDSRYLVDAMTLGWATRWQSKGWWRTKKDRAANPDLWKRLLAVCERHRVAFEWVKGHAGHEENERCDGLAMNALKQPDLPVDAGYEPRPEEPEAHATASENQPGVSSLPPPARQGQRGRDAVQPPVPAQMEFCL